MEALAEKEAGGWRDRGRDLAGWTRWKKSARSGERQTKEVLIRSCCIYSVGGGC